MFIYGTYPKQICPTQLPKIVLTNVAPSGVARNLIWVGINALQGDKTTT